MTIESAILIVQKMHVLFLMFGTVLIFASNASSTIRAEKIRANNRAKRKKNKTARRANRRQRPAKTNLVKRELSPKTKGAKARPLSNEQQRLYDAYIVGRDFPGFKNASNEPENTSL